MGRQIIRVAIALAVVTITAACDPGGAGTAAGWRRIDVPVQGEGWLNDVAVISPSDVWAVGTGSPPDGTPFALHWDGTRWSGPTSGPDGYRGYAGSLDTVSATGPSDVWAAGDRGVVHFDGVRWTAVDTAPASIDDRLTRIWDIAAVSATDAWLVAHTGIGPNHPVIEHWDGQRWSRVPTPAVPTSMNGSTLRGLAAASAADVWAVGHRDGAADAERGCLIEHWDGIEWSLVPCPAPADAATAFLNRVSVLAPDDVWAVGGWMPRQKGTEMVKLRALVEHWDGTQWRVMPAPDVSSPLWSVAARSGSDIVAGTLDAKVALVRWDGSRWHDVALAPLVARGGVPTIAGLASGSDGRIWAVGRLDTRARTDRRPIQEGTSHPLVLARDP